MTDTPVVTRTAAEWDELRVRAASSNREEVAQHLAENKTRWEQERKAYEATQATTRRTGFGRFGRLVADAVRSVVAPASLIERTAPTAQRPAA